MPFYDCDAVAGLVAGAGLAAVEVMAEDKCFVMLAARKPGQ